MAHFATLLQVDKDLNTHTKDSLRRLKVEAGDEGVQELTEWKPVSDYWTAQPHDRLHIFVKLPAAGEWGSSLVNMNNADGIVPPFPVSATSCFHLLPVSFALLVYLSRSPADRRVSSCSWRW